MAASQHTERMLRWWMRAGVHRADLAVKRADGAMLWHADQTVQTLPLSWARAQNAKNANVYVRPARGYRWPLVFLDDVPCPLAAAVTRKYAALVVCTSQAGGCHLWLRCAVPLAEDERREAQRYLALRLGADPASISGEHLGRLAGFRNCKRNGVWVNVLQASELGAWHPAPALESADACTRRQRAPDPGRTTNLAKTTDSSASGADWAFTRGLLEAGCEPALVHARLVDRARQRRGSDAERYAAHTLRSAMRRPSLAPMLRPTHPRNGT